MDAHGYTMEYISKPEQVVKSFQAEASVQRVKKAKSDDSLCKSNAEAGGIAADNLVPTKYWKLADFSRNILRDRILPSLEPNNFSVGSMKATVDKFGVARAKLEYVRMVQFVTGWTWDLAISGALRDFSVIQSEGFERSVRRGRRGLQVMLPMKWQTDGLFSCDAGRSEENAACVLHRFIGVAVLICRDRLPYYESVAVDLYVDCNWSEHLACIRSKHSKADPEQAYVMANDFPDHTHGIKVDPQALQQLKVKQQKHELLKLENNGASDAAKGSAERALAVAVGRQRELCNPFTQESDFVPAQAKLESKDEADYDAENLSDDLKALLDDDIGSEGEDADGQLDDTAASLAAKEEASVSNQPQVQGVVTYDDYLDVPPEEEPTG